MTTVEYLRDCLVVPVVTNLGGDPLALDEAMTHCVDHITRKVGIVHLVGNGGSAAVVAHAHNDLVKAGEIRAMVHQDIPLLTASANDNGYVHCYTTPLATWLHASDLLIAVSSSGMSDNILVAVRLALLRNATVVTFSGFTPGNLLRPLGHLNFYVPSSNYGHVELTHAALLHCLTDRLAQ